MGTVSNLMPPWKPGQSGNPAGRPRGARSKLEEAFLDDLYKSWQGAGPEVIERVIKRDPATYLRVVASLLPKKVEESGQDVTRDRVRRAIETIESWIAAGSPQGDGPGAGEIREPE